MRFSELCRCRRDCSNRQSCWNCKHCDYWRRYQRLIFGVRSNLLSKSLVWARSPSWTSRKFSWSVVLDESSDGDTASHLNPKDRGTTSRRSKSWVSEVSPEKSQPDCNTVWEGVIVLGSLSMIQRSTWRRTTGNDFVRKKFSRIVTRLVTVTDSDLTPNRYHNNPMNQQYHWNTLYPVNLTIPPLTVKLVFDEHTRATGGVAFDHFPDPQGEFMVLFVAILLHTCVGSLFNNNSKTSWSSWCFDTGRLLSTNMSELGARTVFSCPSISLSLEIYHQCWEMFSVLFVTVSSTT